jgi:ammonium transporter Rh
MFQDVNVMMFIGFGLLMTFLKKYSHSAIGINFLLTAFVLQWYPILKGWFHLDAEHRFQYDITTMITSEFAAASVLISMGAVLGNMSPEQYVIMAFGEVIFYVINEFVILDLLKVNDAGGSITIHIFGAYFGLTISKIIYEEGTVGNIKEAPNYHSDIFSVIGTIFLFMFWPSFNGAMTTGDQQYRCVINTFLALAACCIIAFATSSLEERKFNMYHIQNCTLAGGVAVGSAANLIIHPFGAMIVGVCASVLCVSGFEWLTPWVSKKFRLHDTCGVNNLHGMPGLIAGIICAIASGCATYDIYGDSLYEIFPAMGSFAEPKRAAWAQALITFASIFISLGFAIVGAIITGFVLRLKFWTHVKVNDMYDDREFWRIVSTNLEVPSHIEVMKNVKQ